MSSREVDWWECLSFLGKCERERGPSTQVRLRLTPLRMTGERVGPHEFIYGSRDSIRVQFAIFSHRSVRATPAAARFARTDKVFGGFGLSGCD